MNGKGDKWRRNVDFRKYRKEHDRIFGKKKLTIASLERFKRILLSDLGRGDGFLYVQKPK